MINLMLIAAGGAAGAVLRYGVAGLVHRLTDSTWPWGTLAVNVLGCLIIGLCGALVAGQFMPERYRLLVMVGVLGSFTTFSTFGYETFELVNDGQLIDAAANVLASNAAGLLAVWLGYRLTEHFAGV
jgi:CrcB protein